MCGILSRDPDKITSISREGDLPKQDKRILLIRCKSQNGHRSQMADGIVGWWGQYNEGPKIWTLKHFFFVG